MPRRKACCPGISSGGVAVSDDRAGHRGRLRQRFRQVGRKGLADYELLELLLSFAIARRDVKPLAKDLIRRFGSLPAVLDAGYAELEEVA